MRSTFNRDQQGWTMTGDVAAFAWQRRSGNPGGSLAWTDAATGNVGYYAAPAHFEGAKGGYYGGTLSYDIKVSGGANFASPDVRITGANGVTLVATVAVPGTDWTSLSIALDASGGWQIGALGGATATRADIRGVLRDIAALEIRAEYVNGDETGGLDNVSLVRAPRPSAFGDDRAGLDASGFRDHAAPVDYGHFALV